MTKSEISKKISQKFQLPARDAEEILSIITGSMSKTLKAGSRIEIRGFGSFYIRDCKPYTGRNPRTGQSVEVKAKRLPCFRQSKEMKTFFTENSESKTDSENPSEFF